jgi:choline dehydrogenase-like flavoprotein
LYVVDASALPGNLGVNPQHTIMALARHWAQQALAAGKC